MIAIKDMEMPNACTSMQETLGDVGVANCPLYNVCKHRDTIRTNYKPSNCPLVEIITCKDCKHNGTMHCKSIFCDGHQYMSYNYPDFYCADAEKKN